MCGACWIKGIIAAIAGYLAILVLLFSLKNDVNIYVFSLILLVLVVVAKMLMHKMMKCCWGCCSGMAAEKMPAKKAAKRKR